MQELSSPRLRARGRPAAELQCRVVEDLIAATEHALLKKTAQEITVREISTAAGTSEAMIRYYFGSKEGLLLTVLKGFMDDSPHKNATEITNRCVSSQSIKPLIDELCRFHYSKPNLIKMIVVELFSSSSELKEVYLRRYGHSIGNFSQSVVKALQSANIYRQDINPEFIAMSLVRLVVAPIMESAVAGTPQPPPELINGEWPEFITRTIDSISM
jgi:AcrR family transcriptional regulator